MAEEIMGSELPENEAGAGEENAKSDPSNETEFTEENGNESEAEPQDDGHSAKNAARRRNKEEKDRKEGGFPKDSEEKSGEREWQKALQEAKEQAILDAMEENPYTHKPMKDAEDVREFFKMREMAKAGYDPLTEFSEFQKAEARKDAEKAEKEAKQAEWYRRDGEAFAEKYPNVNFAELLKNEDFALYAEGKVGAKPLADIYEGFLRIRKSAEDAANDKAAQRLANAKASPGALGSKNGKSDSFYTCEEVRKMSPEEVHNNYDKIRASMKKWE